MKYDAQICFTQPLLCSMIVNSLLKLRVTTSIIRSDDDELVVQFSSVYFGDVNAALRFVAHVACRLTRVVTTAQHCSIVTFIRRRLRHILIRAFVLRQANTHTCH